MLKDVLEAREMLEKFYVDVWDSIMIEFPKFAKNVKPEEKYKTTAINATLDMPITVDNEVLQVKLDFIKADENVGKILSIEVEQFGKVPVLASAYLPVKF